MAELYNKKEVQILVVDDIPSARKITVRLLNKLGFTNISECEGVSDSLDKFNGQKFDLLVSDVNLKDGKGTDIIKGIEGSGQLAMLRTLFITSDLEKKEFLEGIQCRAADYLLKPFSPGTLEGKINELYQKTR